MRPRFVVALIVMVAFMAALYATKAKAELSDAELEAQCKAGGGCYLMTKHDFEVQIGKAIQLGIDKGRAEGDKACAKRMT